MTADEMRKYSFEALPEGGYSEESVDAFVESTAKAYDELFEENKEIVRRLTIFAKKLDEYFGKSFKRFEEAIKNEYEFNQIEGISVSLNNKIYDWYYSEKEQAIWMPLIDELKFRGDTATTKRKILNGDNVLENRNIAVVGIQDASELDAVKNALSKLGFSVDATVTSDTEFMLVSLKG